VVSHEQQHGVERQERALGIPAPSTDASAFLRRLIPLPAAEAFSLLSPLSAPARGEIKADAGVNPAPQDVGLTTASLVSQAASILDEEMARGVLAARRVDEGAQHAASDRGDPVLRHLHDLADDIAAIWQNVQGASRRNNTSALPVGSLIDGPWPRLKPSAPVRPGQRAKIGMKFHNQEDRPVQLVPAFTDLLSGSGGRISAELLEFMPRDVRLEAGEQVEVELAVTVPTESPCGSYFGLLVVRGVEYLSALIAIDVR
jgi:hypothetical protein